MPSLYMGGTPDTIAKYVIFSGDPWRVEVLKKYLDDPEDVAPFFEELIKLHITGCDMESACMMTVGRLMGVKTCVLTMCTVLENLKEVLKGQARTDAEDLLCRTALEGICNYNRIFG